jgi:hypothetical protein
MSRFLFRKLPKAARDRAKWPQQLFQAVADNVSQQVEKANSDVDAACIEGTPFAAQVVYWLWRFQCEAGTNGFEKLLLDNLGIYAPQMHAALLAVGAKELVRRMEAGIPHARGSCAEFNLLQDKTWFEQFKPTPSFPTLQSVDEDVYPIIASLTDAVESFILENAEELFE